jgi:hypothetical protein
MTEAPDTIDAAAKQYCFVAGARVAANRFRADDVTKLQTALRLEPGFVPGARPLFGRSS